MSMTPSRAKLDAYRLRHAAEDGLLLVYYCSCCRRGTVYIAREVVSIFGPDMRIYDGPGDCSICGVDGVLTLTLRTPSDNDVGMLVVRRPVSSRVVWTWKESLYEADPKPEEFKELPNFWAGRGP